MFPLCAFFWDPNPIAFYIPILNIPVLWYSLFFACGFFLTYYLVSKILYNEYAEKNSLQTIKKFIDSLVLYLFIGMLLGARLGHVFFYQWSYYQGHLHKIFYTWEGGLASHGAAFGIIAALFLFWRTHKKKLSGLCFLQLFDMLCIGVTISASAIRVGNFFNQELSGTQTNGPLAVFFGHHFEGYASQPCHAVQLYEASFYLLTLVVLYQLFKRKICVPGQISGLFFLSIFTFRFCIEYLKLNSTSEEYFGLYTAQVLSIPFMLLGLFLLIKCKKKRDKNPELS